MEHERMDQSLKKQERRLPKRPASFRLKVISGGGKGSEGPMGKLKEIPKREVTKEELERFVESEMQRTGIHPVWSLYDTWCFRTLITGRISDVFDRETATALLKAFITADGDPNSIVRNILMKTDIPDLGILKYCRLPPLPEEGRERWKEKILSIDQQ
ncbi:hypothetical protein KKB44_01345 [Candidatus Micrarchaeota archaeon]|nr:hypothetical protein [Candidatus Micrarchaeota archaeon]